MSELCKNVVIKYKLELRSLSWKNYSCARLMYARSRVMPFTLCVIAAIFCLRLEIYINGFSQKILFCALYICVRCRPYLGLSLLKSFVT